MIMRPLIPAPYRWLAIAGLVVAVYFAGWLKGAQSVRDDWDDQIAEQMQKTASVIVKQADATVQVVTKHVDRIKVIREQGETIVKEIPVYVTREDDARCVIPPDFVRLHNDAASGAVPRAAGDAHDPGSGLEGLAAGGEALGSADNGHHELHGLPRDGPGPDQPAGMGAGAKTDS